MCPEQDRMSKEGDRHHGGVYLQEWEPRKDARHHPDPHSHHTSVGVWAAKEALPQPSCWRAASGAGTSTGGTWCWRIS